LNSGRVTGGILEGEKGKRERLRVYNWDKEGGYSALGKTENFIRLFAERGICPVRERAAVRISGVLYNRGCKPFGSVRRIL